MSFILDALKRVERERARARHPLLDLGTAPPSTRRRVWPWALAAALAANAVVAGVAVWRWSPERASAPTPPGPVVASTPAPEAASPLPRPERVPSRPADAGTGAPESPRSGTRSPHAATAPRTSRAPGAGLTPATTPSPAAPPAPATASAVTTPEAPTTATAPAAPSTPVTPPAQPSTSPPAQAVETPAVPTLTVPRRPVDPEAPAPRVRVARPEPPPASPPPVRPEQGGAAPMRSASELSSAFRTAIESLKLEVLLYAESAADRMVFINGRKYVEGQRIGDRVAVERITAEGAVLAYEGQRFLLTPAR